MNNYIGNEFQVYGVEEYRLENGYQDFSKMLHVKNGKGLDMVISLDRGGDIVYLTYKGINVSYITPNGIVHHSNYDSNKTGWIKHFTAGFLTTCGYENAGAYCEENGKEYPLHGSINYTPVHHYSYEIENDEIKLKLTILDESIFSRKLLKERYIFISLKNNSFKIKDVITNRGGEPFDLLTIYHFNIGYPLLKEDSVVEIDYDSIIAKDEYSKKEIDNARTIIKPTKDFGEMVYFYKSSKQISKASVYSPSEKVKLTIEYNTKELPILNEWKMMGIRDYVLGLEPSTVDTFGYVSNKKDGRILKINPDDKIEFNLNISLTDN